MTTINPNYQEPTSLRDANDYPTCEESSTPACEKPLWCVDNSNFQTAQASLNNSDTSFNVSSLWRNSSQQDDPQLSLLGLPLFLFLLPGIRQVARDPHRGFTILPHDLKKMTEIDNIPLQEGDKVHLPLYAGLSLEDARAKSLSEWQLGESIQALWDVPPGNIVKSYEVPATFKVALNLELVWNGTAWNINLDNSQIFLAQEELALEGSQVFSRWQLASATSLSDLSSFSFFPEDNEIIMEVGGQGLSFKLPNPQQVHNDLLNILYPTPLEIPERLASFLLGLKHTDPTTFEQLSLTLLWTEARGAPQLGRFLLEAVANMPDNRRTGLVAGIYNSVKANPKNGGIYEPASALKIFHYMQMLLENDGRLSTEQREALAHLERIAVAAELLGLDTKTMSASALEEEPMRPLGQWASQSQGDDFAEPDTLKILRKGVLIKISGIRDLPTHSANKIDTQVDRVWQVELHDTMGSPLDFPQDVSVYHRGSALYFSLTTLYLDNLAFMMDAEGNLYCLQGQEALDAGLQAQKSIGIDYVNAAATPEEPSAPALSLEDYLKAYNAQEAAVLLPRYIANLCKTNLVEDWPGETQDAEALANFFETLTDEGFSYRLEPAEANAIYRSAISLILEDRNMDNPPKWGADEIYDFLNRFLDMGFLESLEDGEQGFELFRKPRLTKIYHKIWEDLSQSWEAKYPSARPMILKTIFRGFLEEKVRRLREVAKKGPLH